MVLNLPPSALKKKKPDRNLISTKYHIWPKGLESHMIVSGKQLALGSYRLILQCERFIKIRMGKGSTLNKVHNFEQTLLMRAS